MQHSNQMFIAEEQVFVPYSSQTSASGVLSFGQSVQQKLPTKRACVACKRQSVCTFIIALRDMGTFTI
jgi:hypothetical protein